LTDQQRELAMTLVHSPDNNTVRRDLLQSLQLSADGGDTELPEEPIALADNLKDVEAPGGLSKVGPSLRHLEAKVDYQWLFSWIRQPSDFRPTTRMPQFFGHFRHLNDEAKDFTITGVDGEPVKVTDR